MTDGTRQQPTLHLFAGVNGSGKTSLYKVLSETQDFGERVSIDDTARELGDWRDPIVQIKAGRAALRQIRHCIEENRSFNLETTLPGQVIVRQMEAAREAGYQVILYFLGVDTVEIAVERVRRRIAKGGHGIPENLIAHRFDSMTEALTQILPLCDLAFFYDNSESFRQVALLEHTDTWTVRDCEKTLPDWLQKTIQSIERLDGIRENGSTAEKIGQDS